MGLSNVLNFRICENFGTDFAEEHPGLILQTKTTIFSKSLIFLSEFNKEENKPVLGRDRDELSEFPRSGTRPG